MKITVKKQKQSGNLRIEFCEVFYITREEIDRTLEGQGYGLARNCGNILSMTGSCMTFIDSPHSYSQTSGHCEFLKCELDVVKFFARLRQNFYTGSHLMTEQVFDSYSFRHRVEEVPALNFVQIVRHELFQGHRAIKEAIEIVGREEMMHLRQLLRGYIHRRCAIYNDFCKASFTFSSTTSKFFGGIIFHNHSQTYSTHT